MIESVTLALDPHILLGLNAMMPWIAPPRVTDLTTVLVMGRCRLRLVFALHHLAIPVPVLSLWNVVDDRLEET